MANLTEAPFAPPQQRHSAEYHWTPLVLGRGTFATVYAGVRAHDGLPVAIKVMQSNAEEGVPVAVIREVSCLRRLSHPHVLRLLDLTRLPGDALAADHHATDFALIFEQCDTDLSKLLKSEPDRVHEGAPRILRQLLSALDYLSRMGVAHRDLKPQNVLVRLLGLEVKLADFGLARAGGLPVKKYAHPAATPWYRAPDVILGSANYHAGIDMWSAGCVYFEMLAGVPLLEGTRTDGQILRRIRSAIGEPDAREVAVLVTFPNYEEYAADLHEAVAPMRWPDAIGVAEKQLIMQMLRYLPSDRLTAADALRLLTLVETAVAVLPQVPAPPLAHHVMLPSLLRAVPPPPSSAIVAPDSATAEPPWQHHGTGSHKSSSGSDSSVVEPAANNDDS